MFRFFRKIRHRLLVESKLGKYLFYVLGEILLVVIGILLALQVNNMNEARKERQKENKVLSNLLQDFQTNLENLDTAILKSYPDDLERLEKNISYIGATSAELNKEAKQSLGNTGFARTIIVDGTLASMLGSDQLELIRNDSLKSLLTKYPAFIERFKESESHLNHVTMNIHRPVLESYITLGERLSDNNEKFKVFKSKAVPSNYEGLLKDHSYQNVLVDNWFSVQGLRGRASDLRLKTEEIIGFLKSELDRSR